MTALPEQAALSALNVTPLIDSTTTHSKYRDKTTSRTLSRGRHHRTI
jgi:hypothetical protein